MKKLFLVSVLFFLYMTQGYSQTHFIAMGQTEDMIYSDFIPDTIIPLPAFSGSYQTNQTELSIDVNRDNVTDFIITFSAYGGLAGGGTNYTIKGIGENYFYSTLDSVRHWGNSFPQSGDSGLFSVAKRYLVMDAGYNTIDTFWSNQNRTIQSDRGIAGAYSKLCDNRVPYDTDFYCFTKTIIGTDTLLGFIHFTRDLSIKDFACEGPTSSYIISSVADIAQHHFLVYPNPFKDEIVILGSGNFNYELTDLCGRLIEQGWSERTINTAQLLPGNYILSIGQENSAIRKRVVKVK